MSDAEAFAIRAHMERMMGIPVGIQTQDVYPMHVSWFARGYSVSFTSAGDEPVEETAARMARGIWMAALSDEPGAFSSQDDFHACSDCGWSGTDFHACEGRPT